MKFAGSKGLGLYYENKKENEKNIHKKNEEKLEQFTMIMQMLSLRNRFRLHC